ncbi:MAG TPA: hypothetical protein VND65_04270 [Candidatus Binatia bacterium]|nr:hypothetical protein [Candidatus Binatia bacterium]
MKTGEILLFVTVLCAAPAFAQSNPATVYAESFRQGSTQIVGEKFEVKLTPEDREYRERVKDSHGADRYVLSIVPEGPEGDKQITSWHVELADLHHKIYNNVLMSSPDEPEQGGTLYRLDPGTFARVPLTAKRIIKVDNFYVVLQVLSRHFSPPDSPYLDSINVAIELTNSDPRKASDSQK